jgi:hypothetical protein
MQQIPEIRHILKHILSIFRMLEAVGCKQSMSSSSQIPDLQKHNEMQTMQDPGF